MPDHEENARVAGVTDREHRLALQAFEEDERAKAEGELDLEALREAFAKAATLIQLPPLPDEPIRGGLLMTTCPHCGRSF